MHICTTRREGNERNGSSVLTLWCCGPLKGMEEEAGDVFTDSTIRYAETGISWHYTSNQSKPHFQSVKNVRVQASYLLWAPAVCGKPDSPPMYPNRSVWFWLACLWTGLAQVGRTWSPLASYHLWYNQRRCGRCGAVRMFLAVLRSQKSERWEGEYDERFKKKKHEYEVFLPKQIYVDLQHVWNEAKQILQKVH